MDVVRKLIIARVDEMQTDLKSASLAMGRNHAYLQQFINRGVPVELKERDREKLAAFLKVPERLLRLPQSGEGEMDLPADGDAPQIASRLKEAREALGLSQADLAERVGMKQTGVGSIEAGESRRPRKLLELSRAVNKTPEWLLGEDGFEAAPPPPTQLQQKDAATGSEQAHRAFVFLPRYSVSASAGPGLVVDSEAVEETMAFRRDWLRRIGANPATSGLITAKGVSMEPTIPDGALMLVDTSDTRPTEGCVYAITRDDTLIVKRVQLMSGGLVLISDNSVYQPERVVLTEGSDLRIAGRVRWIGRTV